MSNCKNSTTHYEGCDCHEQGWIARLDLERKELIDLRAQLAAAEAEIRTQKAANETLLQGPMVHELKAENARLRAALEKVASHGCCVMHNDSGCPGCAAKIALSGEVVSGDR